MSQRTRSPAQPPSETFDWSCDPDISADLPERACRSEIRNPAPSDSLGPAGLRSRQWGRPWSSGQDLVAVDAQDIDCMAEGTAFGRDWESKSSLAQKIRRRLGRANFSIQTSSRGAHCYAPART